MKDKIEKNFILPSFFFFFIFLFSFLFFTFFLLLSCKAVLTLGHFLTVGWMVRWNQVGCFHFYFAHLSSTFFYFISFFLFPFVSFIPFFTSIWSKNKLPRHLIFIRCLSNLLKSLTLVALTVMSRRKSGHVRSYGTDIVGVF